MENKKIISETFLLKFFKEFTTHTAFLAFPLIAEVVTSGIFKLLSPIHLFLGIGLFLQTFLILKVSRKGPFFTFILYTFIPFLYLFIEYIDEGNILNNYIYVLYFFFVFAEGLLRVGEQIFMHKNQTYLPVLFGIDIALKILVIPVFYFLLELEQNQSLTFIAFFFDPNSHTHLFLFCIFVYLSIIFSLHFAMGEKRRLLLDNVLSILHKYSSYIVDADELSESLKKGEIKMNSKKMYKAVVFMDIRGFTAWSEANKPEDVTRMLNGFYKCAEDEIIHFPTGKINKYVADEIVFVFDDLDEAIDFSLILKQKEIAYLETFGLKVGFGINAGVLIYGWIGGTLKKEQTVIGDVVNTAARLEGGVNQIKIPKNIIPSRYEYNDLGVLPLKGKSKDLEIVEIIQKK